MLGLGEWEPISISHDEKTTPAGLLVFYVLARRRVKKA
jgi:hypothetical protein